MSGEQVENKKDDRPAVGKANGLLQKVSLPAKKYLLMAAILLVLAGLGAYVLARDNGAEVQAGEACTGKSAGTLLEEASGSLAQGTTHRLEPLVKKIEKLENYDQDPNCLNIVATYYINISDAARARSALDKLELVYDDNEGFDARLGSNARSMDYIRTNVEFLEKQQEMFERNTRLGPEV